MKFSEKHETDEIIPISRNSNDNTRQIRYYHDRIDFRGEILMKPPGAKSRNLFRNKLIENTFI